MSPRLASPRDPACAACSSPSSRAFCGAWSPCGHVRTRLVSASAVGAKPRLYGRVCCSPRHLCLCCCPWAVHALALLLPPTLALSVAHHLSN
eukprot:scaffold40046_cov29-Tisochrysis_lutea.AAC.4